MTRANPGRVPVGTGTAPVPADQAAVTSIVLGIGSRRGDPHLEHAVRVVRLHMGVVDATASATLIARSV